MPTLLHPGGATLFTGGYAETLFVDITASVPPATLPVFEPWTVANATGSMTGLHPWVQYLGSNQWSVVSQAIQLENSGSGTQGGRLDEDLGTSDMRVTGEVIEFTHPGTGVLVNSVAARMQGDTSQTYYAFDLLAVTGVYSLLMTKFVAGGQENLFSVALPGAPVGTSTLGLDVTGAVTPRLRGFYNGVQRVDLLDLGAVLPVIATGQFAGVQGVANNVGNRTRMDNFGVAVAGDPVTTIGSRRTLSALGTRMGSRQLQEA